MLKKTLELFLTEDRGVLITTEKIVWLVIGLGIASSVGFGIASAERGLGGKTALQVQCSDPAYYATHQAICDDL